MQPETRKLVTSIAMLGGVAIFVSSYWVTDSQIAVNRRYVGMIAFGAGLAFK
jgi:hypothetical protein